MMVFLRNTVAMSFWTLVILAVAALNAWAIPEHYLSIRSALELLGTEQFPLDRDPLVGVLFRAVLPGVALSHAIALSVAAGEFLILFLVAAAAFEITADFGQWRAWRAAGDEAEASEYASQLLRGVVWFAILLSSLYFIIRWDLDLFRFRTLASGLRIEDPAQASGLAVEAALPGSWLALLSLRGGWGYLALTTGAAFALKYSFEQVSRKFALAMMPIERFWQEWTESDAAYVGDDGYEPADDGAYSQGDDVPYELDDRGHDAHGYPLGDYAGEDLPGTAPADHRGDSAPGAWPAGELDEVQTSWVEASPYEVANPRPVSDLDAQPSFGHEFVDQTHLAPEPTDLATDELIPVIGGGGIAITLSEALQDEGRFHVDRARRRVWDLRTWQAITTDKPDDRGNDSAPGMAIAS